ncbi:MAG: T9SS type A sorting domain-containing protein [Candidatus Latescibacteria bacterium]|nr:T9SS type A sorting domain-containing protein [Candidatus Latescibacterota bacterium]
MTKHLYSTLLVLLMVIPNICSVMEVFAETGPWDYEIRDIEFDKDNVMWVAVNDQGIFSYDGVAWTHYTASDINYNSDRTMIVREVAVDQNNVKWFGFANPSLPVSSFDGTTWTHYSTGDELPSYFICNITIDQNNVKWFGTYYGGVWSFDDTTWKVYNTENSGLPSLPIDDNDSGNCVNSVAVDENNVKWFGSNAGISNYDGSIWNTVVPAIELEYTNTNALTVDRTNTLWCFCSRSILSFDGTTWTNHTTDTYGHQDVYKILEDNDGIIWFCDTGGVYSYDGQSFASYPGVKGPYVWTIAADHNNVLWAGSKQGLFLFEGSYWTQGILNTPEEQAIIVKDAPKGYEQRIAFLSGSDFSSLIKDNDDSIWLGRNDSGIIVYQNGYTTAKYTDSNSGLILTTPLDIIIDNNGVKWFCGEEGISCFNGSQWKSYTTQNGLPVNDVRDIDIDQNGVLWFATFGGGVVSFDGTTWTNYTTEDGLAENKILSITIDKDSVKWFGGNSSGLTRFDGNNMKIFTEDDGLGSNYIAAMDSDFEGVLWLGTIPFTSFDGNTFTTYTVIQSKTIDEVSSVYVDNNERIWLATINDGVYQYDGNTWYHFKPYNTNNIRKVLVDSDETVWFATSYGLIRYNEKAYKTIESEEISIYLIEQTSDGQWNTYQPFGADEYSYGFRSVCVNADNIKWFGHTGDILSYDNVTFNMTEFVCIDGISDHVYGMAIDNNGTHWYLRYDYHVEPMIWENPFISSYDGSKSEIYKINLIFRPDDDMWQFYPAHTYDVEVDRNNVKWFAHKDRGIVKYDGIDWEIAGIKNVFDIAIDRTNKPWFAGSDGIKSTYELISLNGEETQSVAVDYDNIKWFGGINQIWSYDENHFKHYIISGNDEEITIKQIVIGSNNEKWFLTNEYLFCFDESDWTQYFIKDNINCDQFNFDITYLYANSFAVDNKGIVWIGMTKDIIVSFAKDVTTGVSSIIEVPRGISIDSIHPNPFNLSTTINFTLSERGHAILTIYDITGRKVCDLVSEELPAGSHSVIWDGRDNNGYTVSSGLYISNLHSEKSTISKKMILLK